MSLTEIAQIRSLILKHPAPEELQARRQAYDRFARSTPPAADVKLTPLAADGLRGEWSSTPGADESRVLLYLHGGAYTIGSLDSHRHLVTEIGRAAGIRTLALEYRLAPEHPYPAALDDALSAYRLLLQSGVPCHSVAIGGDSAGGGLATALLVALRTAGLPQPACAWCISPWVDLALEGDTMQTKAAVDPIVGRAILIEDAGRYLQTASRRTPLASPLYADLRGLPRMLLQVGSAEVLLDDSVRLAKALGLADVSARLEIWPDMIHVWHMFYPKLSAARDAIKSGAKFIRSAFAR
jgi:epsilon-lactone hydrolase